MELLGIVLVLAGVAVLAMHAVLQRSLSKHFHAKELLVSQSLIGMVVLLAMLPAEGLGTAPTAPNTRLFLIGIAIVIAANSVFQPATMRMRALADASLTAPVLVMTIPFTVAVALLLGEWPSRMGWAGILVIMLGNYVHSREGAESWRDYLRPLKRTHLSPDDRRALRFALLAAVAGTAGLIGNGLVSRSGDLASGYLVYFFGLAVIFTMLPLRSNSNLIGSLGERVWAHRGEFVGLGLCFGAYNLLIDLSYRLAPVAYVGSLKRLQVVMIVLFAWVYLGEHKAPRRLIPAGIVTVGAMLLLFDPASTAIVDAAHNFLK